MSTEGGDTNGGGRISVSRDALRAELAELRLALMTELRVELDRKASIAHVELLEKRMYEDSRRIDALEDKRRETDVVASALIKEKAQVREERDYKLSGRQKLIATVVICTQLLLSILALGPDLIHRWTG